ncbi:hypothetical protein [Amycolatopsis sp. w19]
MTRSTNFSVTCAERLEQPWGHHRVDQRAVMAVASGAQLIEG